MIRADDRVEAVLKRDPALLEVFVGVSPAFAMLRNPVARKTMARLVTIEQAARVAGIDASVLLERLNAAFAGEAPAEAPPPPKAPAPTEVAPAGLLDTPANQLVELDVREDLRAGREPFRQILQASMALQPGQVLRLRAIFEPAPLYAVLGKQGLSHYTECLAADDWRVWFYRDAASAAARATPADGGSSEAPAGLEDDVVILDVRGLEPPEPMVLTLEALEKLPRGKTLMQINVRVPQFLLPKLAERGFVWEAREQSADLVRLFIRHKEP
jgi:uncharacterized protein (DUF2249 family)